jgi:predicted RNA binding protein YcfA (HicA-like mRNA interferase family)
MERDSRKITARLLSEGWIAHGVTGSHHHFKHPDRPGKVTVPHPAKDLPRGTVNSIRKQAGWPKE